MVGEIVPSKLTVLTFMTCSELSSGDRHLISFAQISEVNDEWIFKSDLPSASLHCIDVIIIIGKSMCISEGHGGAGDLLACGPASAHCIHSKS